MAENKDNKDNKSDSASVSSIESTCQYSIGVSGNGIVLLGYQMVTDKPLVKPNYQGLLRLLGLLLRAMKAIRVVIGW